MKAPEVLFPPRPDSIWVATVVEASLSSDGGFAVPADLPIPNDWSRVLRTVTRHRLQGLVVPHLSALSAPAPIIERAQQMHRTFASRGLRVAHDTARVSQILADSGIDHLIVKGVPIALVTGKDLATRGTGDVDLWVRPADVAVAEEALAAHGWSRRRDAENCPHPNDGLRWRVFLSEMNEFPLANPDGTDIDLHWKLYRFESEFSFDFDSALAAAQQVRIGSVLVPTLSPQHALEHMAQHGRKEVWPNLRSVVDIAWLATVIDEDELRKLATTNRNVRIALALASRLVPSLGDLVQLDRSDRRIATEAWEHCLATDSPVSNAGQFTGWEGLRQWLGHHWWMWRTAPSWAVRRSQLRIWIQRARGQFDRSRRPWVDHSHRSQEPTVS